jgi:hypothetical protein
MNRHVFARILKALFVAMSLTLLAIGSDMTKVFQKVGRVDESGLAQAVASPRIYAFDLSRSGQNIALLVTSGDFVDAPTWLIIANAKTAQLLRKVQISEPASYYLEWAHFPPQVAFSPDEKFIVVRAGGQVNILDVATLRTVRTVEAPKIGPKVAISICSTGKNDLFAISFGTGQRMESQFERIPVHVEIIDVSDGTRHGSWDSDDIPQSLSPNAKLAAVSDHSMGGALLKLDVIDTSSGKKLALLDGGLKFEKPEAGQTMGRVIGRFVSDEEILLSPDSNFDRSGHHSGKSLRIAHVPDGKIVQVLKPDQFGPTGEIGSSANGEEIVAASWYLKPDFFTHPHEPMPAGSAPELLVFSDRREFHLAGIINSTGGGLRAGGPALPFRIGSDGSVIAIAENHGITVFEKTE